MHKKSREFKAIIFWEGFPACGLLVKKVLDVYKNDVILIATKPAVPFKDLENILNHKIIWLDHPNQIWDMREKFNDRNLIIHTGWNHNKWIKFDKFLKRRNSAKVVVVSDNKFTGSFRQYIGAIYFRLKFKHVFDAAFVPGRSGKKLLRFLGMPSNKIIIGNYGAHELLYSVHNHFEKRKNEFLYVGQLNKRKSIDILIKAFNQYRKDGGSWTLRIIGNGPMSHICNGNGIINEGFTQPHNVSRFMNTSKVLILASRHDNWGTVVCEAAACGMNLLLSKNVGAHEDILEHHTNGLLLPKLTQESIYKSLFHFEKLPESELINGSFHSIKIAKSYDSNNYFKAFQSILNELGFIKIKNL